MLKVNGSSSASAGQAADARQDADDQAHDARRAPAYISRYGSMSVTKRMPRRVHESSFPILHLLPCSPTMPTARASARFTSKSM